MRGEDAYKEDYEHIELFDEPGLFTNGRIDLETVPAGWYCYDLRGSDDDPGDPTTVEEQVTGNHAGTVLLPKALKLNKVDIDGTRYRKIGEGLNFLDGEITLEEFCKEHGIVFPDRKLRYELKPIPEDEFSRLGSDDEETEPYAIGYVRIDFGRNGTEFWNTWWPKNEDKFNTPAFKTALQEFIDDLRAVGPLRDRRGMEKYCSQHADGKRHTWLGDLYGYTAETEHYRFCMRFDPRQGMYDCYLYAYDLDEQKRLAKEGQTPKLLSGSRRLRAEDITFGGEIMEMDNHRLNFCMECWFVVDEVFGTNVCTSENEDYLNVYADYDMANGKVCDELSITLCHSDGSDEYYAYRLSDEEKALLLPKMAEYCKQQTDMSLAEYSAEQMDGDVREDNHMMNKGKIQKIREQYPVGTLIHLNYPSDLTKRIHPGSKGEVVGHDENGLLLMKWKQGLTSSMSPDEDFCVIFRAPQPAQEAENNGEDECENDIMNGDKKTSPLVVDDAVLADRSVLPQKRSKHRREER